MTPVTWVLLAVFAVAAVSDWWAVATAHSHWERIAKPVATGSLVLAAATMDAGADPVTQWAFVAGLALALLGDVLLLPPRKFAAGLGAFLAAHAAFILGMSFVPSEPAMLLAGCVLVLLTVSGPGLRVLRAVRAGDRSSLLTAVGVYMLTISLMAIVAWSTGVPAWAAGATAFLAGDLLVAWREFIEEKPWMRTVGTVAYHAALLLLVLGLLA